MARFFPPRQLDVVLRGREGAERSAYRPNQQIVSPYEVLYCANDAEYVVRSVTAYVPDKFTQPDARHVFLGGEPVLEFYAKWWNKYGAGDGHRAVVRQVGAIRSPKSVEILADLATKSSARKEANAWFKAHLDYALPHLDAIAKHGGDLGTRAKALLGELRAS